MSIDPPQPSSPRLAYRQLDDAHLRTLQELLADAHVRRFLVDDRITSDAWCAELIEVCRLEQQRTKLGLWLLHEHAAPEVAIGLAGYLRREGPEATPQLLCALKPTHTGRGYAREAAVAMIDHARARGSLRDIDATVDEVNVAWCRLLARLGFAEHGVSTGPLGKVLTMRLAHPRPPLERRTERLIMRPFCDDDLAAFARLNADPKVMEYLPEPLDRAQSNALAARLRAIMMVQGFGLWALEAPGVAPFIGFTGLHIPLFQSHFTPCIEVSWRLAREHWGHGYASEAARAALQVAFTHLGRKQVVSFTAVHNRRSRQVMERLGMRRDPKDDFDHPALPISHPLSRHVLYRIDAPAS